MDEAIEITAARVICSRHGEPFRATWPAGYLLFAVQSLQYVTGRPGFWEEAKRLGGTEDSDRKKIEYALDIRPMCCRLTSEKLIEMYEAAKFGVTRRCRGCDRKRLGAPYSVTTPTGEVGAYDHICFGCVVHNLVGRGN